MAVVEIDTGRWRWALILVPDWCSVCYRSAFGAALRYGGLGLSKIMCQSCSEAYRTMPSSERSF